MSRNSAKWVQRNLISGRDVPQGAGVHPHASSLHMVKKAVAEGWQHVPFFFIVSPTCLVAQLTPVSSPLLTSDQGHVSSMYRIPHAHSCSSSFTVLLVADMWRLRGTKGQRQFVAGRVWRRNFFGLLNVTGLKSSEMLCRSAMIKGVQKESKFPKSHNFPYDVKLMRISSAIWERHPRRAWVEFLSTYGTSYVWLKTSNETRVLTLYRLLEAARSSKAS